MQILILRHPREPRQPDGTVPLMQEVCGDSMKVATGLSWANISRALGYQATPAHFGVLFLGTALELPAKPETNELYIVQKDKTLLKLRGGAKGPKFEGLILLDGNWRQSKTLWWRNPWLTRVTRLVLNPKERSRFSALRKEPRRECLSTLEACALTLEVLTPGNPWSSQMMTQFDSLLGRPRPQQHQKPAGPKTVS